jgi:hypothetical protein
LKSSSGQCCPSSGLTSLLDDLVYWQPDIVYISSPRSDIEHVRLNAPCVNSAEMLRG